MFECSEQLLFSCVSSKVIVCHAIYHMSYFTYHMSIKGQMLILILGTCQTTFFFMSMLKVTDYKYFFTAASTSPSPVSLDVIELVPS